MSDIRMGIESLNARLFFRARPVCSSLLIVASIHSLLESLQEVSLIENSYGDSRITYSVILGCVVTQKKISACALCTLYIRNPVSIVASPTATFCIYRYNMIPCIAVCICCLIVRYNATFGESAYLTSRKTFTFANLSTR